MHYNYGMNKYDITLDNKKREPIKLILDNIKPGSIVLEFGPANGRMTKVLYEELGCHVYIVELVPELFDKAIKYADDGICSDIMKYEWVEAFKDIKFDYIIFADVLEHLTDPMAVLENIKIMLKEDGIIYLSIPNIAHNDVILSLLEDNFEYHDTGLLDNTHIHFFTYKTAKKMFFDLGYKIIYENAISKTTSSTELEPQINNIDKELVKLLFQRDKGEKYQLIFGITLSSKMHDAEIHDEIFVERRIYFDCGNGYSLENALCIEEFKKNRFFSLKCSVPYGTRTVRFDPALRLPCRIFDLHISCDSEEINDFHIYGGERNDKDEIIINSLEGQITICLEEDVRWLSFTGKIVYDINLMTNCVNVEQLTRENDDLFKTNERLLKENNDLAKDNDRLLKENNDIKKKAQICFSNNKELQDYSRHLKSVVEELEMKIQHIYDTKSWRYTKIFRDFLKQNGKNYENSISLNLKDEGTVSSIWKDEVPIISDILPLVSIIVPNYNHEEYLRERLDSIYSQTYSNYEVILLDDCSTDLSRTILEEYANEHFWNTRCVFNEQNGGMVFNQWNKGIELARGELIWIAESDDYSSPDFLEKMVSLFKYESIMLAFSKSVFVKDGQVIWTTEEYLQDLHDIRFDEPFIMSAHEIVNRGFAIKNIIPNVSSVVFRNTGVLSKELQNIWGKMKLSGDWIFYLNHIRGGCIAYTNQTINYYRVHEKSTSLKIQKTKDYYLEYKEVTKYVTQNYMISDEVYKKILHDLKEHYKAVQHVDDEAAKIVAEYYNIDEIKNCNVNRLPNVLMACFGICSGGGETYPLYLANEMKKQGVAVTILNLNQKEKNDEIRKLLHPSIPVINVNGYDDFYQIIDKLGIEIVHSHHTSVDEAIASWMLNGKFKCKHIVSLHGMYEMLDDSIQNDIIKKVNQSCKHFIYISDKNIEPFKEYKQYEKNKFTKLPNGLPCIKAEKMDREKLNIGKEDFVLCIVSRGIAEKGWKEGIEAISLANTMSKRKIHLVIVGDGEIREELEKNSSDFIHFVGEKRNVRDYFAMSDMGFLPTKFKGESYPLTVIECLQSGKPVIATDIAEVKNQLTDEKGNLAGVLLSLNDWELDINEIAEDVCKIANSESEYKQLLERVASASKKFNIETIVNDHIKIYKDVLDCD